MTKGGQERDPEWMKTGQDVLSTGVFFYAPTGIGLS